MREPFANTSDLQEYWRTLTPDEINRAKILLTLASDRLRMMAQRAGIDLDAKIAADPDGAYANTLKFAMLDAVKRALQVPADVPPINAYQQTAGPYSENITYANPTGDLYFKKSELTLLGISGGQSLNSLSTTPNNKGLYGGNE
jgi:phage protein gp19/gp15/gp42